jgi:hypothetical protein
MYPEKKSKSITIITIAIAITRRVRGPASNVSEAPEKTGYNLKIIRNILTKWYK